MNNLTTPQSELIVYYSDGSRKNGLVRILRNFVALESRPTDFTSWEKVYKVYKHISITSDSYVALKDGKCSRK
jgi:hypothetical protein